MIDDTEAMWRRAMAVADEALRAAARYSMEPLAWTEAPPQARKC